LPLLAGTHTHTHARMHARTHARTHAHKRSVNPTGTSAWYG